jgi:hypothetical protein
MAMPQPNYEERRTEPRLAVRLEARLFPGGRPCLVKDISLKGARIELSGPESASDELVLVVWLTGQAFEAQAVWWRGSEIGVRFIRTCELSRPAPPTFREAQLAWAGRPGAPEAQVAPRPEA